MYVAGATLFQLVQFAPRFLVFRAVKVKIRLRHESRNLDQAINAFMLDIEASEIHDFSATARAEERGCVE